MSAVWYRVDSIHFAAPLDEWERPCGDGRVEVITSEHAVLKETPRGVQLDVGLGRRRFVMRQSKRQFASPTIAEAREKFRRRKARYLKILAARIADTKKALAALDELEAGEKRKEL